MVEKVNAALFVGQSNNEPQAPLFDYFALVTELDYRALTPDPTLSIYYGKASENLYFLTFYHPEVAPGTLPAGPPPPPFASLGWDSYAKWLPFTHREGPVDNPNILGFRYPNCFHMPRGPLKDGIAPGNPAAAAYGIGVNLAVDIGVRFHGLLGTPMYLHQAAISGVSLEFKEQAQISPAWGWFDPRIHSHWAPADANGLFARLVTELNAAKIAAEEIGKELEYQFIHISQGEADSSPLNLSAQENFPTNAPAFVAALRQAVYDAGLCSCSPHYLPVIWERLSTHILQDSNYAIGVVNDVLDKMAMDDPAFATYNTDSFSFGDAVHYSAVGIRQRGAATLDAFLEVRNRRFNSMPLDDVPTLTEMIAMVREETERNTGDVGGSDSDPAVVTRAINNTLNELYQSAGDSAWWMRYIVPFSLTSSPYAPIDLPLYVTRLLEIHPAMYPFDIIPFVMLGHIDSGRVRIATKTTWSGDVDLHCIYEPRYMLAPGDKPLVPRQYVDAIVAGAAWRVANQSGNAQLELKLRVKADILASKVMGHIQKVDRQRRGRITGNRARGYNFSGPSWSRRSF